MSVLIKGITKPTDCILCPMFNGAWQMCDLLDREVHPKGTPEDCPMSELPPHGRLIDAEEYKAWVENWFEMHRYYHPYSKSTTIPAEELYDVLERVPTIIEAEGE